MGQRGTTSSWSEGKKGYLFPHFPVKCEFSFPWTYRTKFDAFSDIDNFSIISKLQFFDIDNFADNLTNANLSAFDNFFPIYRWPLATSVVRHFLAHSAVVVGDDVGPSILSPGDEMLRKQQKLTFKGCGCAPTCVTLKTNQHQSASVSINQQQSPFNNINQHKSTSISINQHQSAFNSQKEKRYTDINDHKTMYKNAGWDGFCICTLTQTTKAVKISITLKVTC